MISPRHINTISDSAALPRPWGCTGREHAAWRASVPLRSGISYYDLDDGALNSHLMTGFMPPATKKVHP